MPRLKEAFEIEKEFTAFYTGGKVVWTSDGRQFLCQCRDKINIVDAELGSVVGFFGLETAEGEDEDSILTFAFSVDNTRVASAHRSGLIRLWSFVDKLQLKMWRSVHRGPIALLAFNEDGHQIASGGCDGTIRLWHTLQQTCSASLKGAQGVFSVMKYLIKDGHPMIFGAADDLKIRSWEVKSGAEVTIYSGHYSKVTSINFTKDSEFMVSSGRDSVLILWNLSIGAAVRTLAVYESIEDSFILPESFILPGFSKKCEEGIFVASAGQKGVINVWDISNNKLVYSQTGSSITESSDGSTITHLLYCNETCSTAIVTHDHNVLIYDLETFQCSKQIVGFSDEILDLVYFGSSDTNLAVATNSADLKVYNTNNMNCDIVKGHTNMILSLATFSTDPNLLITSSKDKTVRIWQLEKETNKMECVSVGTGHSAAVGSVCGSQMDASFIASVSQDSCLKIWRLEYDLKENKIKSMKCTHTELAHNMDINCVTVSPNDRMIATGSQDKTAKLWSVDDLSVVGLLKGHRRGIWCVKFSPVDQVLLTASADCTLKLWSLSELNCLKTFEGHESSVLKAEFLSRGLQIVSSSSDGLVRFWDIKTSECKFSLDKHEGKVWALTVSRDENYIFSGDSESVMVKWKNVTEEKREAEAKEKEKMILQEQELSNLLVNKKFIKALKLALRLEKPFQVLKIVNSMIKDDTNNLSLAVSDLNTTQKEALVRCAVDWNTNTRNCHAAQTVLNMVLSEMLTKKLNVSALPALVESALPYTERHFDRLTNMLQDLHFLTYTINCMQPHAKQS